MKRLKVTVSDEVYEYLLKAKSDSGISLSKLVADILVEQITKSGKTGKIANLINEIRGL